MFKALDFCKYLLMLSNGWIWSNMAWWRLYLSQIEWKRQLGTEEYATQTTFRWQEWISMEGKSKKMEKCTDKNGFFFFFPQNSPHIQKCLAYTYQRERKVWLSPQEISSCKRCHFRGKRTSNLSSWIHATSLSS